MPDKLVKIERWGLLFVGGKDTNNQPKSCFNCPHLLVKQEACEYMNPNVILRKLTVDGQVYTPVCGYQIGGLPTVTDKPQFMGKDPEELGLEWAKGTGTNCYGYAGGAPCERFIHTQGEDGICAIMSEDDNKVDSDDCCAAHKGPSMDWKEAQKRISSNKTSIPTDNNALKLVAIFVRHGQTEANKEKKFRGPLNIPLDATGKQQAVEARSAVSSLLHGEPVGSAFVTPKDRSQETGDIVLGPGKTTVIKNLDPFNVGEFAGQPKNEANMKAIMHYQLHPEEKIPGGERLNDFRKRVNPEIMMVIRKGEESGRPSIAFVHSSTIHQVSHLLHHDHNAVKVTPGGIVGVYKTPDGRYIAKAILHQSHSEQDKHMVS